MQALKEQQRAFREKFGRDPGPQDPVFFDPDASEPRFVPEGKLESEMVRAMNAAGIDPAFIYAYKVTGLMVTEQNRDTLSDEEALEWDTAVEEFRRGTG